MNYSSYQKAIFDFPLTGDGDAVVIAGPGSGKTTTIIETAKLIPNWQSTILLSFNKHIAEELARRLPPHAESATLNAFGWRICKQNIARGVKINSWKTANHLKRYLSNNAIQLSASDFVKVRSLVMRLVGLMKAYVNKDQYNIEELIEKQGIIKPEIKGFDLYTALPIIYGCCINDMSELDFDDQKFFPVFYGWPSPQYDFVLVDEAQDLAPLDVALVEMMGGRKIFVGDPSQSVYGFRGADPDSINNIIKKFDAVELPLTICYRCPNLVIDAAKKINPRIEKPEINGKGEGIVADISRDQFRAQAKAGDFVLSRTTAPLITECLKMLPIRYCYVKGRDIGEGLMDLIDTITPENLPIKEFNDQLKAHFERQTKRLKELEKEYELSVLEDRVEGLEALMVKCNDVGELKTLITQLIPSNEEGNKDAVVFMSMHRAKGLETDDVYLLRPLPPHPKAKQEWQLKQEDNLLYVAITRAQHGLYYVDEAKRK